MNSLLVISPHPDDLEISSGLLVCVAISKGWEVNQIILTDGRYGGINKKIFGSLELINQRKREALIGASILGVSNTFFGGIEDGRLCYFKEFSGRRIKNLIDDLSPTLIVIPSETDTHIDHKATAELCEKILTGFPKEMVLKYSFWGDNLFNTKILAPQFSQTRLRAISAHKSQPIQIYIKTLIRRGGLDEDRFSSRDKIEKLYQLLNPYLKK